MVRHFLRSGVVSERWNGLWIVLLTTGTAVKVAEKDTWIHASHCKLVKDSSLKEKENNVSTSTEEDKEVDLHLLFNQDVNIISLPGLP